MATSSSSAAFDLPISKPLGEPIVVVSDVTKKFKLADGEGEVTALNGISFKDDGTEEICAIRRGEFVVLRGPSGGGKTTLINILGTIDKVTSGSLELLGVNINDKTPEAKLSRFRLEKIGFVFQTFNLLSALSAFENVELPMILLNSLSAEKRRKRAIELLTLVGLGDRINHLPSELSGGEQQRVTIARSLANNPELLLLDEPTGDLDSNSTVQVMDLILDINLKMKTTVIMVTHNEHLECYGDRIIYMADGRVASQAVNSVQSALDYDTYQAISANQL